MVHCVCGIPSIYGGYVSGFHLDGVMAIYSFKCTKCGHVNEFICSVGGQFRPTDVCERCGGGTFVKVPSVPSDPQVKDGTPKFYGGK